MQFARHLRPRVANGEITCSVRVWQRPRVKTGGRYRMAEGSIVVTSVRELDASEVTDDLAVRSGFADTTELFATARHGRGDTIYCVTFLYEPD